MSLLGLIPTPWRLAAGAVAVAAAAVAVFSWGAGRYAEGHRVGYAAGHAEFTALHAEMTARALAGETAARAEEQRRAAALQEIEDAHQAQLQRARADAAIADAAAGRLRQRVAELIAAARSGSAAGDAPPAAGSPPATDPTGLLADVLGRCVADLGRMAAIADERGAAGSACERAYDALTP